ncbi:MAG TPA: hypothetical protein VIF15_15580 [Polyangiaceae bacterium]|jgi:hypothetical protein
MRARRGLLFTGLTMFVVSATHPVGAGGPWEAEAGAYGGSTTGHMACGPDMRIAYGGGGGEVRYAGIRGAGASQGFAFDAGALAEYERAWPTSCNSNSGCGNDAWSGVAPSARARVGYDWSWFGFRLGAILWSQPQTLRGIQLLPVPDLALRFGSLDAIRLAVGFGAYDLPTYLRPGLYGGLLFPSGGSDIGVYLGAHYSLADSIALREALTLRAPLSAHLWLRVDLALMESVDVGADAMLGLGGDL